MMNVLLLLLGLCLSQVWTDVVPSTGDNDLIQFLAKARSLGADPDRFDFCFNIYTKALSSENAAYNHDYKSCIEAADKLLVDADNATAKARDEIYEQVGITCGITKGCATLNGSVVDELNCLEGRAKSTSYTMSGISADAALTKDELENKYQSITAERDICVLRALQQFNRRTEWVYAQWEDCLKGTWWTTTTEITTEDSGEEGPSLVSSTAIPNWTPGTSDPPTPPIAVL